jgi:hypothetical protein
MRKNSIQRRRQQGEKTTTPTDVGVRSCGKESGQRTDTRQLLEVVREGFGRAFRIEDGDRVSDSATSEKHIAIR